MKINNNADDDLMKTLRSTLVLLALVAYTSLSLAATDNVTASQSTKASVKRLSVQVHNLVEQIRSRKFKIRSADLVWQDLEDFQVHLMQAMVSDPVSGENNPKLSAAAVTRTGQLKAEMKKLMSFRATAEKYKITAIFDKYLSAINQILKLRVRYEYTLARRWIKDGVLPELYDELKKQLVHAVGPSLEVSMSMNPEDKDLLLNVIGKVDQQFQILNQDLQKDLQNVAINQKILLKNQELMASYRKNLSWVQSLLWGLVPLFCLTSLVGGIFFSRYWASRKAAQEIENFQTQVKTQPINSIFEPNETIQPDHNDHNKNVPTQKKATLPKIIPMAKSKFRIKADNLQTKPVPLPSKKRAIKTGPKMDRDAVADLFDKIV